MFIYAGIDEAGYGPKLGPLVVGCAVLAIPNLECPNDLQVPDLWARLGKAVVASLREAKQGQLVVADSKKLKSAAAGLRHLERGCLAFQALIPDKPEINNIGHWLDAIGCQDHRQSDCLPWYIESDEHPWQTMPSCLSPEEHRIDCAMLRQTTERIGVSCLAMRGEVVMEHRFNQRIAELRNKSALSFEHVSKHLDRVWQTWGHERPMVAVDRQGGRTTYRELLAMLFGDAHLAVLHETPESSAYELTQGERSMVVRFQTKAETHHMPVALASMISKYTRELLMQRLNTYFCQAIPGLKPTAGYATDGKRFLDDVAERLPDLGLSREMLERQA